MGHSSLPGSDRAAEEHAGRDTAILGPGDSSDTGSDMAGIGESDDGDPNLPVDLAMRDDNPDLVAFIDAAQATDPLEDETADGDLADEDIEDDNPEAGERYAEEDDAIPGAKPTRKGTAGKAGTR